MKKVLLIIVCVLICLFGFGCDPGIRSIDADETLANTVKIELVHYENENPKTIPLNRKKKPIFDFNKVTLIATLDESRFEDVVNDIASNDFLVFGSALNEPIGKTLILYQSNGNMIVLCNCVYTNEKGKTWYYGECNIFDENGMFVENLGDIDIGYVDMLELKYFESNP